MVTEMVTEIVTTRGSSGGHGDRHEISTGFSLPTTGAPPTAASPLLADRLGLGGPAAVCGVPSACSMRGLGRACTGELNAASMGASPGMRSAGVIGGGGGGGGGAAAAGAAAVGALPACCVDLAAGAALDDAAAARALEA